MLKIENRITLPDEIMFKKINLDTKPLKKKHAYLRETRALRITK